MWGRLSRVGPCILGVSMAAPLTASSIHEAELGFSWVAQESKHRALRSGGRYSRLSIHTRHPRWTRNPGGLDHGRPSCGAVAGA